MTYLEFERRRKGWSQIQLGRLVGIHQTFISMMECGTHLGGVAQRERLAKTLDLPIAKLLEQVPSAVEIAALAAGGK